jgi:hypothetical protein
MGQDQWPGYILSFQVNSQPNITFFRWCEANQARCLLGAWAKQNQRDIIPRIFAMLEQPRQELLRQSNIPTRAQIETFSEVIRHTCFTNQISQTISCDRTPIAMGPNVNLWEECRQIFQEAEGDYRDGLAANEIGMELEHYDWQEWDTTEYCMKMTTFFDRVNFFLPSLFFQIGHENFRFQTSWMEEYWGRLVQMLNVRYCNSLHPETLQD